MGAGTMTRNMRLGLVILAAVLICAGCVGEPAGDFSSTAGQLDSALQELDGQDLLNGPVFADGYSCCGLGDTVLYWANHWYGPHQIGSVILAENQETGEFSLVDLGCWQRLSIREIRKLPTRQWCGFSLPTELSLTEVSTIPAPLRTAWITP